MSVTCELRKVKSLITLEIKFEFAIFLIKFEHCSTLTKFLSNIPVRFFGAKRNKCITCLVRNSKQKVKKEERKSSNIFRTVQKFEHYKSFFTVWTRERKRGKNFSWNVLSNFANSSRKWPKQAETFLPSFLRPPSGHCNIEMFWNVQKCSTQESIGSCGKELSLSSEICFKSSTPKFFSNSLKNCTCTLRAFLMQKFLRLFTAEHSRLFRVSCLFLCSIFWRQISKANVQMACECCTHASSNVL